MTTTKPIYCVLENGLVQVGTLAFDVQTGDVKLAMEKKAVDALLLEAKKKNGGREKPNIIIPSGLQVVPRNNK